MNGRSNQEPSRQPPCRARGGFVLLRTVSRRAQPPLYPLQHRRGKARRHAASSGATPWFVEISCWHGTCPDARTGAASLPPASGGAVQADLRTKPDARRPRMLWTITILLFLLWLVGMVSNYTLGGFIHLLLLLAIVTMLIRIIQGRRPV